MLSKWIILFLIGSLPFGQDVIGDGLYEEELINFLRANYKTSTTLGYNNARDVMYLEIDREDDGSVYGIYTNYAVFLPESGVDPSTHLYENGMNCEHIWPQSMYEGSDPMKSDMHHLRPSKSNVNSSRGNNPFNEIFDYDVQYWFLNDSQITYKPNNDFLYSEGNSSYFEPRESIKGDIARSMFYVATIYDNLIENDYNFDSFLKLEDIFLLLSSSFFFPEDYFRVEFYQNLLLLLIFFLPLIKLIYVLQLV